MSHNLQECIIELQRAMKSKNKNKRKVLLEFLAHKNCIYEAMREISMNIKKLPLNKKQKTKLNKKAKVIKTLANGVKRRSDRKKLILQTGGFLPWLLPIVATLITTAIENSTK